MATLTELTEWTAGIYQLEEEDVVQGGPDGIDNVQAKQLANRTLYLKALLENFLASPVGPTAVAGTNTTQLATTAFVQAAAAALVASSPAALDTLNELAAALGNDANFAATITNALALKAPLASPAFTDTPTAPTPALLDNTNKLATTAFVQAIGLRSAGASSVPVSATVPATDAGKLVLVYNVASAQTVTLPAQASVPVGTRFHIQNDGTFSWTVGVTGADSVRASFNNAALSVLLGAADDAIFESLAGSIWQLVGGSALLKYAGVFGASLAANGYQKFPSGLIIQWGFVAIPTAENTNSTTTFPITFPTACRSVVVTDSATMANNAVTWAVDILSAANFTSHWARSGMTLVSTGRTAPFIAIGH